MNNFCKDCKWSRYGFWEWINGPRRCFHPKTVTTDIDFSEGSVSVSADRCNFQRTWGECGNDGKFWEPKTPALEVK